MPFQVGHKPFGGFETRFNKGHKRGMSGKNHKEESIKKMSENRKGLTPGDLNPSRLPGVGKKISEAKKGIPHYNQRGENHPNWKNGKENLRIRGRLEYKQWRKAVFERDDYTCRSCGVRGGVLNAHHVQQFAKFPELRFEIDNGLTLCVPCHKETDTYLKGGN